MATIKCRYRDEPHCYLTGERIDFGSCGDVVGECWFCKEFKPVNPDVINKTCRWVEWPEVEFEKDDVKYELTFNYLAMSGKTIPREDIEYLEIDGEVKIGRPKLGEQTHIPEGTLMREIGAWFGRNPGRAILVERRETERGRKHIATIEEIMPIGKCRRCLKTITDERAERSE